MSAPIRVLVIDDEEPIRRNLRAFLEDGGYVVSEAANGEEGLEIFDRDGADVVLTDLRMGVMGGLGFILALRKRNMDIPVIVVSGTGGIHDAITAIREGAWDYVVKPVQKADELDIVIRRCLERAHLLVENRQHREHLEELVEERTRQFRQLQDQLTQVQKMEAIGRFAGGVAHDFRNQLTVIMGYGQMLIRRNLVTDEGRAMLEEILKAAERSSTITGQLLAFSRKETLHPSVQSIRDVIADIGKILPHMVGEDIRMMIQSSTDACQANIDAHLFQQAIMNLATNARDAMPKGGTLTIDTACVTLGAESRQIDPELAEGPYVVVTVSDTGNGMDAATLAKVFDPFFTTKEVGKGTGLGLAMVYGFVKQSGGAVAMQSELGRGTTMRLYFPQTAASPAAGPGEQRAETLQGGVETVLFVEDEPAVRAMAVALLREVGYRVLEAADAEEALRLTEQCDGDIDVLVTDVVMPGTNGAALAEQLKARYPGLGVLYISGYPGEELSSRGMGNALDSLPKPFTHAVLLSRVRHALDQHGMSPEA